MKLLLAILQLVFAYWTWWATAHADEKKRKEGLSKEVDDAIDSGDISRIHSVIERINRV